MDSLNEYQHFCQIRCPAKAILCGEHAVVYSKDAVAIAIGLFCKGFVSRRIKIGPISCISIQTQMVNQIIKIDFAVLEDLMEKHQTYQKYSFEEYEKQLNNTGKNIQSQVIKFFNTIHYKISLFLKEERLQLQSFMDSSPNDYNISILSQIPIGKCLGSSAAFNTVLATFLFLASQKLAAGKPSSQYKKQINNISYVFEAVEHGTPSGIDNFITVNGGAIIYNKQKDPKFRNLNISSTNLKNHINIGIIDSGIQKNTKKAVQQVRRRINQDQKYGQMIDQIGNITGEIINILENPNFEHSSISQLLTLTKRNHYLLKQLGVSHEQIEKIVEKLSSAQRSVKITGSGMGGCVIVLSDKFIEVVPDIRLVSLEQQGLKIIYP